MDHSVCRGQPGAVVGDHGRRCRCFFFALIACCLIGGCSAPTSERSALLSASYHLIDRYYLEPIETRRVGEASLQGLTKLDRDLGVAAQGDNLVLEYHAQAAASFPMPDADDWRRWGETAAQVTAAAAKVSPRIADLSGDTLDQSLMEGAIGALDPFSRYLPPGMTEELLREGAEAGLTAYVGPVAAAGWSHRASVDLTVDGDLAIISIHRFTSATGGLLRQLLARAFAGNGVAPRGIILDLRDDPGGQLAAAVEVADLFLNHGIIVALEGRDGRDSRVFRAVPDGSVFETIPLAVMIDGGSTSAAEVVAAAIQGNGRAIVIGSSSFGKGTAQRIIPLNNGGQLWITSSYMRAPAGYLLQHHGVVPDICTRLSPSALRNVRQDGADASRSDRYRELSTMARNSLTETQWLELRLACPPWTHGAGDGDIDVAKQILHRSTVAAP